MRTTVDLPDELFRRLKTRAASSGMKLKDLLAAYVERGLAAPEPLEVRPRQRSDPPIFLPATGRQIPAFTQGEVFEILDQEDADARWG